MSLVLLNCRYEKEEVKGENRKLSHVAQASLFPVTNKIYACYSYLIFIPPNAIWRNVAEPLFIRMLKEPLLIFFYYKCSYLTLYYAHAICCLLNVMLVRLKGVFMVDRWMSQTRNIRKKFLVSLKSARHCPEFAILMT